MENKVDELLDKIAEHLHGMAKTDTVMGEEFVMGEYTCKPIIRVGLGFGSAAGSGEEPKAKANGTGTGAGAGIGISPVGFLVSKGNEISFISTEKNKGFGAVAERIPDIVEKVVDLKNKQESAKKTKEAKEDK